MNEYDSRRLADVLRVKENMSAASSATDADLIVLNTCSVREKAQEKLFGELGRLREHKLADPNILIGVAGCVASQEGAAILARAPYVDLVFGPQALHRLPQMIKSRRRTGVAQLDIEFPEMEKFDSLPSPQATAACASIAIMEGCSKYCSFCVVPYTRGPEFSRPLVDILDEAAILAEQGVREITLLGQNVNAYAGIEPDRSTADLARLIECIAHIDSIKRIRYTTSHPVNFTSRLIDAHRTIPKLAPHVHLPVQSGDDRILASMKRGYTALEYRSLIRKLRAAVPDVSLTSDFIVGFPGETEKQFCRTLELTEQLDFDGGFAFIYSPRPGTPAANLPDPIAEDVKKKRLHRLQEALERQFAARQQAQCGCVVPVLVAGRAKRGDLLTGRAPDNRVVNFAGPAAEGDIVDVAITGAGRYSLKGEIAA